MSGFDSSIRHTIYDKINSISGEFYTNIKSHNIIIPKYGKFTKLIHFFSHIDLFTAALH